MSRIRSIKPEFWTSEQVLECSTNARLLFLGLWNFCDDAGRHPYSAKQAKAEVFPADDFTEQDVLGMLDELAENNLIARYASGGKEYFYVTGWKHQRIDKPQAAKYPDPFAEDSKNVPRTIPPDTIGKDRIGEDTKSLSAVGKPTRPEIEKSFSEFWTKYPKRDGDNPRKSALKAYAAAIQRGEKPEDVEAGLDRWITQNYAKIGTAFVPQAVKWLHDERWKDALAAPATVSTVVGFQVQPDTPQYDAWRTYARDFKKPFLTKQLEDCVVWKKPVSVPTEWPPNSAH